MADTERRNTIDPETVQVGYRVINGGVMRSCELVAVGKDINDGRLFVQTRQLAPIKFGTTTYLEVLLKEKQNSGLYCSQEFIDGTIDNYVKRRDDASWISRSDFLGAMYVSITRDLNIIIDEKRIGLWQAYNRDNFSAIRIFDGKPGTLGISDNYQIGK